MITILHGNNIPASRLELQKVKETSGASDIRQLDGRALDPTSMSQALSSQSMVSDSVVVIIERLIEQHMKKPKVLQTYINILVEAQRHVQIILWEQREITPTLIGKLSATSKLFNIPSVVFRFLDSLQPGNIRFSLELFHQTIESEKVELVFSMIVKRIRQLLMIKYAEVPDGLAAWQVGKLNQQAKGFTQQQLHAVHTQLLDTDMGIKTGNSPFSLTQHIEQILFDLKTERI